jgi:hypothetical protein
MLAVACVPMPPVGPAPEPLGLKRLSSKVFNVTDTEDSAMKNAANSGPTS